MNRRQYLTRTGAGIALVSLAGCLDSLSENDSGGTASDRTGVRALDRAAGKLNEAALALDFGGDGFENPADVSFDPDEPTALIDDARDHLETAAAELGEDRQPDVETLRTYADVLERLVAVTATATDDALEDDIDTVSATLGGDGDLGEAERILEQRTSDLETARTRIDTVVEDFDSIDEDRLAELASIDPAELEAGIAALDEVVESLDALAAGYESMLSGYEDLERGRNRFDDGEYKRAEAAFEDAESAFETAGRTLEGDGDAETPAGLTDRFEVARCQADHLAAAAAAFADGNRSDGEQHLDEADSCAR